MSVYFSGGALSQNISPSSPLTYSCWFNVPDVTNNVLLMSISNSGISSSFSNTRMHAVGNQAGDPVAIMHLLMMGHLLLVTHQFHILQIHGIMLVV